MSRREALPLETVSVIVPEEAVPPFEAAIAAACGTVGLFEADPEGTLWRIEGVREPGANELVLQTGLALAAAATGLAPALARESVAAEGWLARTAASFPPLPVGRRFWIHGAHLARASAPAGRIPLAIDAGVAFGSGEHGSTRGCLRMLELAVRRRPRHVLDLGTGSGVLALAAAKLLPGRSILATDIEPWSVRVAGQNARINRCGATLRCVLSDGWRGRVVRAGRPYDLVLANILARPLARMAPALAAGLAPRGQAILSGLLDTQVSMVLAAHRRVGLRLVATVQEGRWATLLLGRG